MNGNSLDVINFRTKNKKYFKAELMSLEKNKTNIGGLYRNVNESAQRCQCRNNLVICL
jgi:hypothetical protein